MDIGHDYTLGSACEMAQRMIPEYEDYIDEVDSSSRLRVHFENRRGATEEQQVAKAEVYREVSTRLRAVIADEIRCVCKRKIAELRREAIKEAYAIIAEYEQPE